MPSKEDILEEKTEKELKEMAREMGVSGYSDMEKTELIEIIKESIPKEEIKNYFSEEESTMRGEDLSHASLGEKIKSNKIAVGIIVGIIVALVGAGLGYYIIGPWGTSQYTNENMPFTFSYPSGWNIQESPFHENVLVIKDGSENNKPIGQISMGRKDNSLEDIKNYLQKTVENEENVTFTQNIKYIRNESGIDFTYKVEGPQTNQVIRSVYLTKENRMFGILLSVEEGDYDSLKEDFSNLVESFKIQ